MGNDFGNACRYTCTREANDDDSQMIIESAKPQPYDKRKFDISKNKSTVAHRIGHLKNPQVSAATG